MVNQTNQHRLENVMHDYVKNGLKSLIIRFMGMAIEWILVLILGFETNKITSSDEPRDIWTFVEFFIVASLCVLVWVMKCCCLACCMNCFFNQIESGLRQGDNGNLPADNIGLVQKIIQRLHLILNRFAVGAVGYEIRKRLFATKPMNGWDYAEITIITIFCVGIFTIKYCVLNCYCLNFICCCCKGCRQRVQQSVVPSGEPKPSTSQSANVDNAESRL